MQCFFSVVVVVVVTVGKENIRSALYCEFFGCCCLQREQPSVCEWNVLEYIEDKYINERYLENTFTYTASKQLRRNTSMKEGMRGGGEAENFLLN